MFNCKSLFEDGKPAAGPSSLVHTITITTTKNAVRVVVRNVVDGEGDASGLDGKGMGG